MGGVLHIYSLDFLEYHGYHDSRDFLESGESKIIQITRYCQLHDPLHVYTLDHMRKCRVSPIGPNEIVFMKLCRLELFFISHSLGDSHSGDSRCQTRPFFPHPRSQP